MQSDDLVNEITNVVEQLSNATIQCTHTHMHTCAEAHTHKHTHTSNQPNHVHYMSKQWTAVDTRTGGLKPMTHSVSASHAMSW